MNVDKTPVSTSPDRTQGSPVSAAAGGFSGRAGRALLTGYILLYYGEIVFWATPQREGMDALSLVMTWIVYSLFAYVFLSVASWYRARSVWAVFLAGAVFGWFEEGIVLQTTYGSPATPFPISISFTALAWHALIGVLVGWYVVRKILCQNRPLRMAIVASMIGAVYGYWAVFWWSEPPEPMKTLLEMGRKDLVLRGFATYSFLTTGLLILCLWILNGLKSVPWQQSKTERWVLGLGTLAYFGSVTVPAAPKAIWVLPPLLGLTLLALWRNRRMEDRADALLAFTGRAGMGSYLALFCIPLVATSIYYLALVTGAQWRSNLVIFYVTSGVGGALWIASVCALLFGSPARNTPDKS